MGEDPDVDRGQCVRAGLRRDRKQRSKTLKAEPCSDPTLSADETRLNVRASVFEKDLHRLILQGDAHLIARTGLWVDEVCKQRQALLQDDAQIPINGLV